MATFPTLKWFEDARAQVNSDSTFKALGTNEVRFGVKAAADLVEVRLSAFECTHVAKLDPDDTRELDFVLDMTKKDWNTFLKSQTSATPLHLNDLDLASDIVRGDSPRGRLMFPRFYASIERFFAVGAGAA